MTSYSSQSQTVDRVLVNADANESDLLLNQRMAYVAISRAREEAMIFTNSADQLRAAIDRNVAKEMAVEALRQTNQPNALSLVDREGSQSHNAQQNLIVPALSPEVTNSKENNLDDATGIDEIGFELSE
ncbi:MAG TPA: helicase C-terminal domain-containing protein [Pyrinomonadaceae bacterium]